MIHTRPTLIRCPVCENLVFKERVTTANDEVSRIVYEVISYDGRLFIEELYRDFEDNIDYNAEYFACSECDTKYDFDESIEQNKLVIVDN